MDTTTDKELADALLGLADGQDDYMGQLLTEAAERIRVLALRAWGLGPCPNCDEATTVDEAGCCIHCGAVREIDDEPTEYVTLDITARELRDGDLYMSDGYAFQAQDVRYNQPGNLEGSTRTAWTAVWLGTGTDYLPEGWHRFSSGGNEHRTMRVLRKVAQS